MSAADVDAVDYGAEEDELLEDDAAMEEDEPVAPKAGENDGVYINRLYVSSFGNIL